ncbi:hypothetical protein K443DRAFT_628186 [Laccaria amethystina LaAM-08-1]|uniref:Uncharacterized protein n=1 Tax=Laccaria amethystina LaAM-08-1 TaxID=1095629 RepID=A0A0C9XL21_9AGAR|nr:hypothetical protein K443DRAFT_628186 [Laccaria amethystina LaAM-08-1]
MVTYRLETDRIVQLRTPHTKLTSSSSQRPLSKSAQRAVSDALRSTPITRQRSKVLETRHSLEVR